MVSDNEARSDCRWAIMRVPTPAVLKKNPACAAFCACYKNSRQSPVVLKSLPLQHACPAHNNKTLASLQVSLSILKTCRCLCSFHSSSPDWTNKTPFNNSTAVSFHRQIIHKKKHTTTFQPWFSVHVRMRKGCKSQETCKLSLIVCWRQYRVG